MQEELIETVKEEEIKHESENGKVSSDEDDLHKEPSFRVIQAQMSVSKHLNNKINVRDLLEENIENENVKFILETSDSNIFARKWVEFNLIDQKIEEYFNYGDKDLGTFNQVKDKKLDIHKHFKKNIKTLSSYEIRVYENVQDFEFLNF